MTNRSSAPLTLLTRANFTETFVLKKPCFQLVFGLFPINRAIIMTAKYLLVKLPRIIINRDDHAAFSTLFHPLTVKHSRP